MPDEQSIKERMQQLLNDYLALDPKQTPTAEQIFAAGYIAGLQDAVAGIGKILTTPLLDGSF